MSRCAVIVAEICSYVAPRAVGSCLWERGDQGRCSRESSRVHVLDLPKKALSVLACLVSPPRIPVLDPGYPRCLFTDGWPACRLHLAGEGESQPPRPHPDFRKRVHSTGRNTGVSFTNLNHGQDTRACRWVFLCLFPEYSIHTGYRYVHSYSTVPGTGSERKFSESVLFRLLYCTMAEALSHATRAERVASRAHGSSEAVGEHSIPAVVPPATPSHRLTRGESALRVRRNGMRGTRAGPTQTTKGQTLAGGA